MSLRSRHGAMIIWLRSRLDIQASAAFSGMVRLTRLRPYWARSQSVAVCVLAENVPGVTSIEDQLMLIEPMSGSDRTQRLSRHQSATRDRYSPQSCYRGLACLGRLARDLMYAATSSASSPVSAKFGIVPCFSHRNVAPFARNCGLFAIDLNDGAGGTPGLCPTNTTWQTEHALRANCLPLSTPAANVDVLQSMSTRPATMLTREQRLLASDIVSGSPEPGLSAA
jgi:hypothetical protein